MVFYQGLVSNVAGHRIQYSINVNGLCFNFLDGFQVSEYFPLMLSVCSFDFKDLRLQGDDSL